MADVECLGQARSELRFWRGAEVDKVQNPKQLYVISLVKVEKNVNFCNFFAKFFGGLD